MWAHESVVMLKKAVRRQDHHVQQHVHQLSVCTAAASVGKRQQNPPSHCWRPAAAQTAHRLQQHLTTGSPVELLHSQGTVAPLPECTEGARQMGVGLGPVGRLSLGSYGSGDWSSACMSHMYMDATGNVCPQWQSTLDGLTQPLPHVDKVRKGV